MSLKATELACVPVCRQTTNAPAVLTVAVLGFVPSLAFVLLGIVAANKFLIPMRGDPNLRGQGIVQAMDSWDGHWYREIAQSGYSYRPTQHSSIAFFPAFPLLGRWTSSLFGLSTEAALVLVANLLSFAAFFGFAFYLRSRIPAVTRSSVALYAALLLGVFPTTLFFHMAYSESMLLLLLILALEGMRRHWHPALVAVVIGLATATRFAGIALVGPLVLYLWNRTAEYVDTEGHSNRETLKDRTPFAPPLRRIGKLLITAPPSIALSCWGLIAFMGYQASAFGDPLTFTRAERTWHDRVPSTSRVHNAFNVITLEPLWSTYRSGSPFYWGRYAPHDAPLLNLYFANPVYFGIALALLLIGLKMRWLSGPEWLLGILLLLIPYGLQSSRLGMLSQARFASVTFPTYIVGGELLARLPKAVVIYTLLLCGVVMAAYCMMFASGYPFL